MPTFFGATSVPTDNGTNATSTITFTPPANMVVGDLVLVYLTQRGTATFTVGVTGGQIWDSVGRNVGTANVALETFWTRYNGTWAANPRFDFSAATNTSGIMIVFRPDDNTKDWVIDQPLTTNAAAATTQTISGLTPSVGPSVTVASFHTADDNTWGNLSGTGWDRTSLSAQYRNLAGNDSSSAFAYFLQSTVAPIPNVSLTQLTLGGDATAERRVTFYEAEPFTGGFDPMGMLGFFGM